MRITSKNLAVLLYEVTQGNSKTEIEVELEKFFLFLKREKKLNQLKKIFTRYSTLYNDKQKIVGMKLTSAFPIKETLKKKLSEQFKRELGVVQIEIHESIDPTVLGGVIIHIGDTRIDLSVQKKITRLRETLA